MDALGCMTVSVSWCKASDLLDRVCDMNSQYTFSQPSASSARAATARLMWVLGLASGILALDPIDSRAQQSNSASEMTSPLASGQKSVLDQAADYSSKNSGRAVLVLHRGELAYQRYDNGWSASRPHMLASGTKSFSGVIAMLAVQDELLSLDELACATLTEWKDDPKKSKITIRHLLNLSSGLHPGDAVFPNRRESFNNKNSILRQRQQRIASKDANVGLKELATGNWFADSLKVPSNHEAGEAFEYGPSHFYAFGELIHRKLASRSDIQAKSFEAYARTRLFDPLGIQIGYWAKDQSGNVNIPGGMFLTARDWSKFGQFVLDQGAATRQDGTKLELLKPDLLAECFVPSDANRSYGLTWWLNGSGDVADGGNVPSAGRGAWQMRLLNQEADADLRVDGRTLKVWIAAGLGKQRLYIIPDRQLVVVRFAEPTVEGRAFKNQPFLEPILAAFSEE